MNNINKGCVSTRSQITGVIEAKGKITGKVNQESSINGETFIPQIVDEIPYIRNDLEAVLTVGGIEADTVYLSGTTIEQILRDLLYPLLYPTLKDPSAVLTGSEPFLMEYGQSQYVSFNAILDRGSIYPAYKTSGYRSGPAVGFTLNNGDSQQSGEWNNILVDSNNNSFTCVIEYGVGEQPRDSWGNAYESPLPHGFVQSNTIVYEFVNAIWANTVSISSATKQPLISKKGKNIELTFPPQTSQYPEIFDLPISWNLRKIEVLNTLSGKYEDCSGEFTRSSIRHNDAGGNSVNYYRYSDNRGYNADSRTLRISWD